MDIKDFEAELKLLNKDLSIRPNNPPARVVEMFPDLVKLASIIYKGSEICTIPNYDIYDEPNPSYGVDVRQDGRFIKHRTRPEALSIVEQILGRLGNDKEFHDSFFGIGDYSAAALAKKDDPVPEIVEEVTMEVKEVGSGMIEGAK